MVKNVNKIGLSRFVLGFLGGFIAGIFFGNLFILRSSYYLAATIIFAIIIIIIRKRNIYLLILISLLGLTLGLFSYRFYDEKENAKILPYSQNLTFLAEVKQVQNKDQSQQVIVFYQNTKVLVQAPFYPQYHYGDIIKITGTIDDPAQIHPINGFDYGNYLLKKSIRGLIKNPQKLEKTGWQGNRVIAGILKISDKFQSALNQLLPEPLSTLMVGIIIGLKQPLPDVISTAFARTGLSHVTAVSGYNVTIIIVWISFLLMMISRRVNFWGTILVTIIFIILTGASASVIRAGILAILVICAKYLGRRPYYPILVLLVADLMLIFNPYALKNDISFQLSFLAFAGLLILAQPIAQNKYLQFIPENWRQILGETLGAQILALPILVYNFGLISLVAPLSNILILPTIPATMLIGFLTGIGGMIDLKLGQIFAIFSWLILKYILIVVENLSKLSWAAIPFKTSQWWWMPLYYILIVFWLKIFSDRIKSNE